MLLKQWEEKYNDLHTEVSHNEVGIEVGEDKSSEKRLDALRITDYFVKFFRSKWAILEKKAYSYYGQNEFYDY